jgi:Uma2 family endonuclease
MAGLSTSPLVKTYTLEQFWQLPDPPDGSKLELIAGVLYMTPPPNYKHDNLIGRLIRLLDRHLLELDDKGILYVPRAAIWTGPNTHLEPDLFYISAELEAKLDPAHRNTADLVIEVISPGSAVYDRNTKADTYGALGVCELWLIDGSNKTVEVRTQADGGFGSSTVFNSEQRLQSTVFPKLNLIVAAIFDD